MPKRWKQTRLCHKHLQHHANPKGFGFKKNGALNSFPMYTIVGDLSEGKVRPVCKAKMQKFGRSFLLDLQFIFYREVRKMKCERCNQIPWEGRQMVFSAPILFYRMEKVFLASWQKVWDRVNNSLALGKLFEMRMLIYCYSRVWMYCNRKVWFGQNFDRLAQKCLSLTAPFLIGASLP